MHVLNLKIKITWYTTRGVRALGRVLSVPSYPPLAFLAGFEPSNVPAELSVSGKIPAVSLTWGGPEEAERVDGKCDCSDAPP